MSSNAVLFYVMGSSAVILLSGGVLVGFLLRRKYRRETLDLQSRKIPIFSSSPYERDFIPLEEIKPHSADSATHPAAYKMSPITPAISSDTIHGSSSNSFFEGGEGYYLTPPTNNSNLLSPQNLEPPPSALISRTDSSVPTTPTTGSEADPYGRDVIYLDGLLESKKWKLKDFKVDNETFHKPKKSNVWRTSYNVW
ncbi:hypothetical protein DSO57_1023988 [Entomophthora muscae]|uniref:Uncharacterized protein n=1 Tax=Entomophthora muscae TaxID=34485 RepID=A0ACC2TPK4_9FUNG|nr:hypothetical protein DSO57_1023988 [Entomophthora muscae]